MKRMILWLLPVIFWGLALWFGTPILTQQHLLSLRLTESGAGITASALAAITQTYHAAAHAEAGLITVTAPGTGRDAELYHLLCAGDKSLITGEWLTDGSFGLGGENECIISRAAAQKLFGSEHVAGLTVAADNKEWYVRGVIRSDRPVILLPAAPETLLTCLEFGFSGAADNQREAEQAGYQYGITGHQILIDYGFIGALARLFLWLPFLTVWFGLLLVKKKYLPAGRRGLGFGLMLLFWAGLFFFLFQAIRFPSGYVPAKWSDFAFWWRKWNESARILTALFQSAVMKDILLRNRLIACGGFSVGACAALLAAVNSFMVQRYPKKYCTK